MIKSLTVAVLLIIAFSPVHTIVKNKLMKMNVTDKQIPIITASITTSIMFTLLFIPIIFFMSYLFTHPNEIIHVTNLYYDQIKNLLTATTSMPEQIKVPVKMLLEKISSHEDQITAFLENQAVNITLEFFALITNSIIIVLFFFFLSIYQREIFIAVSSVIPLKRKIRNEFESDIVATTSIGFYSLICLALAQGITFAFFISFFDGYNPLSLGSMVVVTSVVPVFGTAIIWIPVALNELFSGNAINAAIIIVFCTIVLSFMIDNILRIIILQKLSKFLNKSKQGINDFLVFFSMLAGLATFGFWGFLIGPAIISFFATLLRVLRKNHYIPKRNIKA
jgi:predicted PurR-regulated permease PerM